MKADQFGTASEQLRFKDNWRLAEKQKPGHLSARCDNCAGSESGKGKSLQSLSCVRNDYSTKPNAVCDLHSFPRMLSQEVTDALGQAIKAKARRA